MFFLSQMKMKMYRPCNSSSYVPLVCNKTKIIETDLSSLTCKRFINVTITYYIILLNKTEKSVWLISTKTFRFLCIYVCFLFLGNMAAFDMDDPESIVSPGGVGFDINCGVRLLRTNLFEKDVQPIKVIRQFLDN